MANCRLYSTTTHEVWDESSQSYIQVQDMAWVAPNHVIFAPWYQVWFYDSGQVVWDQGTQSYQPLYVWVPYKPGTQPTGYTLVNPQPSGNTNKKNSPYEVQQTAQHLIDIVQGRADALVLAIEYLTGANETTTVDAATMGQINQALADSQAALNDSIAITKSLTQTALDSMNLSMALSKGGIISISNSGQVTFANGLTLDQANALLGVNESSMVLSMTNLQLSLDTAMGIVAALKAEGTAPPDVVAQAQKNVADIQGLIGVAMSNMALALFGYGGSLGAGLGLNNNGSPGIFSGGDDPDGAGPNAANAGANGAGGLDAP